MKVFGACHFCFFVAHVWRKGSFAGLLLLPRKNPVAVCTSFAEISLDHVNFCIILFFCVDFSVQIGFDGGFNVRFEEM